MSRWWKCDLQVATPWARGFTLPAGSSWDLTSDGGAAAAADAYMAAAAARGVEVLVLADHNSAAHISVMIAAGKRVGIHVFPGVEITTASGSDGAHLIILADQNRTTDDFNAVLASACGFSDEHPRFQPNGTPAAAPHTLPQILDRLPDDHLAIAPHAFNDNGIASQGTIEGDLRWKALHHPRLGAIDVGDCSSLAAATGFKARFVRRELTDFPCMPNLAFVSTSDAYNFQSIGSRTTWIRMDTPSIEGLRQAFLDHEARIVCDWDARYVGTPQTPNDVSHAWVESVTIDGLTTASEQLRVQFDPRLNVLIGGRGSGKSTVVAALRCLYGDIEGLPPQTRVEADRLLDDVFTSAEIVGQHHLPYSGEEQEAHWSTANGASTNRSDGSVTPTNFKVRVINQKELFERAANTADDPHRTSRNLLNLVDDSLAAGGGWPGGTTQFASALEELQTQWVADARHLQSEIEAISERAALTEQAEELRRQVEAFDDEARRLRRERNDQRLAEERWLTDLEASTAAAAVALSDEAERLLGPQVDAPAGDQTDAEALALARSIAALRSDALADVIERLARATHDLAELSVARRSTPWQARVDEARADTVAYTEELAALGLDPAAYEHVRAQLAEREQRLASLEARAAQVSDLRERVQAEWSSIGELLGARREARTALLLEVASRSVILKFSIEHAADETGWAQGIRDLLNLRVDGFLEEVPALARWLWRDTSGDEREERLASWRAACVSGDFTALSASARLRPAWATRLRNLDPLVRARIAAEVSEDTVNMRFLRENGNPDRDQDWQPLTAGSPGQRSAAMLSFVLHYGNEPLVLDQPEDDLDTEWITQLVVRQLRTSRWTRQLIVVTHNANIPVNADAERTIVLENARGGIAVRTSPPSDVGSEPHEHCGPLEDALVRADIQQIMEGGIDAFVRRERRYNNELNTYRAALQRAQARPQSVEHD